MVAKRENNVFGNMENLKITSIVHRSVKPFGNVESRKTSGFSIRATGSVRYSFDDREIVVNEGEMIFSAERNPFRV